MSDYSSPAPEEETTASDANLEKDSQTAEPAEKPAGSEQAHQDPETDENTASGGAA